MALHGAQDQFNLEQIQQVVIQQFETIVDMQTGEVGTCKKMVGLGCLNAHWQELAVVFAKEPGEFSKAMVFKEHQLLEHLKLQAYPIVQVLGPVFKVQATKERYGMIQRYMPGVFIEAKTPAPLNLLLTAALLRLPARAQEAWLAFNRNALLENIKAKLSDPVELSAFRERASQLSQAFDALIQRLHDKKQKIYDLQMVISPDGTLTIIDPLEVMNIASDKTLTTLLENNSVKELDTLQFCKNTDKWLLNAKQFCANLAKLSVIDIILQCTHMGTQSLLYAAGSNSKGNPRISSLRASAMAEHGHFSEGKSSTSSLKHSK